MQVKKKGGIITGRGIEWCDGTWNPIAGCIHQCEWLIDGKIAECYAKDVAERFKSDKVYQKGFAHHYFHPERLDAPKKKKTQLKIFVGSMSDIFSWKVPRDHIEMVLQVIQECPQHVFQMLTKNPIRATQFDLPDNVWLGASMPPDFMHGNALNKLQKERMLHRTLKALGEVQATVKFMSFEPLSWDVSGFINQYSCLDWAIIGAASNGNKYYPPHQDDFDKLIEVLAYAKVPVFLKGNMKSLVTDASEWREEFPIVRVKKQLEMFSR